MPELMQTHAASGPVPVALSAGNDWADGRRLRRRLVLKLLLILAGCIATCLAMPTL